MAPIVTVTTEEPVNPQTPSTTHYQQLAIDFMKAFDQMAAVIPRLEEAEAANGKLARTNLNVPDTFCGTAVTAVEQVPELHASNKLDPVEGRDKMQYLEAFRPLCDKAFGFFRRLNYTLMLTKSELATKSLVIYRLGKGLASDSSSPLIEAHVANMKRDLARKTLSKAERDERKAAKFEAAVEEALRNRTQQKKEVEPA